MGLAKTILDTDLNDNTDVLNKKHKEATGITRMAPPAKHPQRTGLQIKPTSNTSDNTDINRPSNIDSGSVLHLGDTQDNRVSNILNDLDPNNNIFNAEDWEQMFKSTRENYHRMQASRGENKPNSNKRGIDGDGGSLLTGQSIRRQLGGVAHNYFHEWEDEFIVGSCMKIYTENADDYYFMKEDEFKLQAEKQAFATRLSSSSSK